MHGFMRWPTSYLQASKKGSLQVIQPWIFARRFIATLPPKQTDLKEEKDHVQAAEWVKAFQAAGPGAIPADAYAITMSRSSGPGGQVGILAHGYGCELNNSVTFLIAECQQIEHESIIAAAIGQGQVVGMVTWLCRSGTGQNGTMVSCFSRYRFAAEHQRSTAILQCIASLPFDFEFCNQTRGVQSRGFHR